jgi:hypothetical protein
MKPIEAQDIKQGLTDAHLSQFAAELIGQPHISVGVNSFSFDRVGLPKGAPTSVLFEKAKAHLGEKLSADTVAKYGFDILVEKQQAESPHAPTVSFSREDALDIGLQYATQRFVSEGIFIEGQKVNGKDKIHLDVTLMRLREDHSLRECVSLYTNLPQDTLGFPDRGSQELDALQAFTNLIHAVRAGAEGLDPNILWHRSQIEADQTYMKYSGDPTIVDLNQSIYCVGFFTTKNMSPHFFGSLPQNTLHHLLKSRETIVTHGYLDTPPQHRGNTSIVLLHGLNSFLDTVLEHYTPTGKSRVLRGISTAYRMSAVESTQDDAKNRLLTAMVPCPFEVLTVVSDALRGLHELIGPAGFEASAAIRPGSDPYRYHKPIEEAYRAGRS